jgi:hypothetical protein
MQKILTFILEALGLVALIYGYSRKSRNLMFAAALVLWFSGWIAHFLRGFLAGVQAAH